MAEPTILMLDELSIAQGRIELEGVSRELAQNEHVRAAYLGI